MNFFELILIALGLSMDAFAVSVSNGLNLNAPTACKQNTITHRTDKTARYALMSALCFGIFQGLMPVGGFFLGATFSAYIVNIDHFVAFALLSFIGAKMLLDNQKQQVIILTPKLILVQGIATSIDALAVGVSFSALNINIFSSALLIMAVTFILSFIGVYIGRFSGDFLNKKANIFGGIILIGIGTKILIEHLFF